MQRTSESSIDTIHFERPHSPTFGCQQLPQLILHSLGWLKSRVKPHNGGGVAFWTRLWNNTASQCDSSHAGSTGEISSSNAGRHRLAEAPPVIRSSIHAMTFASTSASSPPTQIVHACISRQALSCACPFHLHVQPRIFRIQGRPVPVSGRERSRPGLSYHQASSLLCLD